MEDLMKYMARVGIVFVAVIFAGKVTPSSAVENQWYEFFLALFFGGLNALVKPIIEINNWQLSWSHVCFSVIILNFFLYILVYVNLFSWLGVTLSSFGGVILSTIIVSIVSILANHFTGFKTKIE